jgi:hypothetical protein
MQPSRTPPRGATLPPCIRLRTSSVSLPSPQEAQQYPREPPHGLARYHQEGSPASLSGLIESPESPSTLYQVSPVINIVSIVTLS